MIYVDARQNSTVGPQPFRHAAYLCSKSPVPYIIRFSHERLVDAFNRILAAQNAANKLVKSPKENGSKQEQKLTSSPPPMHPAP